MGVPAIVQDVGFRFNPIGREGETVQAEIFPPEFLGITGKVN